MTTTPAMPELPEPRTLSRGDEDGHIQLGYTADQMRAYAVATLQAQPAAVSDAEWWHEVLESAGPDLLALAKQWSDNKIHVYRFTNEAEKIVKAAAQRAILALRPQAVPMTEAWQEVAACPDGDVWFSLSCGHVVIGWKQGHLLLDWEAAIDHDCCYDASAIKAMPVTPPAHHGITAQAKGGAA